MRGRKRLYNTHTIHNHDVIYFTEVDCFVKLETCTRALSYDYRIRDRKDF